MKKYKNIIQMRPKASPWPQDDVYIHLSGMAPPYYGPGSSPGIHLHGAPAYGPGAAGPAYGPGYSPGPAYTPSPGYTGGGGMGGGMGGGTGAMLAAGGAGVLGGLLFLSCSEVLGRPERQLCFTKSLGTKVG